MIKVIKFWRFLPKKKLQKNNLLSWILLEEINRSTEEIYGINSYNVWLVIIE